MTSNRLATETSPYLLQHAHNPVDWYPWGEEALQRAKNEDKPILVSIGYAACHWCHVMERESFEDPVTASIMNRDFINIKIDREERPDLDHIYMDALQALNGHGGWPLNMFLTPDARPFYGGTYFPPLPVQGRPSWQEVLRGISAAFKDRRGEVEEQANKLLEHMAKAEDLFRTRLAPVSEEGVETLFEKRDADLVAQNLLKSADRRWGGFGRAPKFPQTFSIRYLLRHHRLCGDVDALEHACLSLDGMIRGGIYDHVGGGFARYSTDAEWLVPHFEKMTYDNALLVSVLSEACQSTGRKGYADVIRETLAFTAREMMHPDGGFYAALDADSEGVEGKYYTWTRRELFDILGGDADVACRLFGVTEEGNWEGVNILHLPRSLETFSREEGLPLEELSDLVERSKRALLNARQSRPRPLLDDKVLLGWNALMVTALCKASAALRDVRYRDMAVRCMDFLRSHLKDGAAGGWRHTWKAGQARFPAFLDDLSYLAEALIHLHEATGDSALLLEAMEVVEEVEKHYKPTEGPLYHFTPEGQRDVVIRRTDSYDGATASGNSTMAWNLYKLSFLSDRSDWRREAADMFSSVAELVRKYPSSFGNWAGLGLEWMAGTWEIAMVGRDPDRQADDFLSRYLPNRVFQRATVADERFPLLKARGKEGMTMWYACRNRTCLPPCESLEGLMRMIGQPDGSKLAEGAI